MEASLVPKCPRTIPFTPGSAAALPLPLATGALAAGAAAFLTTTFFVTVTTFFLGFSSSAASPAFLFVFATTGDGLASIATALATGELDPSFLTFEEIDRFGIAATAAVALLLDEEGAIRNKFTASCKRRIVVGGR